MRGLLTDNKQPGTALLKICDMSSGRSTWERGKAFRDGEHTAKHVDSGLPDLLVCA